MQLSEPTAAAVSFGAFCGDLGGPVGTVRLRVDASLSVRLGGTRCPVTCPMLMEVWAGRRHCRDLSSRSPACLFNNNSNSTIAAQRRVVGFKHGAVRRSRRSAFPVA